MKNNEIKMNVNKNTRHPEELAFEELEAVNGGFGPGTMALMIGGGLGVVWMISGFARGVRSGC